MNILILYHANVEKDVIFIRNSVVIYGGIIKTMQSKLKIVHVTIFYNALGISKNRIFLLAYKQ